MLHEFFNLIRKQNENDDVIMFMTQTFPICF